MSDKILTEAFDKMKAIEESEDPFCIGATGDTEFTEAYTEVEEGSDAYDLNWDNNQVELINSAGAGLTMDLDNWERLIKEYTTGQQRKEGL